jgi:glycosyltransferase involved in cell wall biosynthesis
MVALMLDALHAQFPRPVYHVNARVSSTLADVGGIRPGKVLRLAAFCLLACWYRFRHNARALYFIPAPPKRSALLRDLLTLLFLRPLFPEIILHWHAVGLGAWAEAHGTPLLASHHSIIEKAARKLTRRLLGNARCSLVIAEGNRADAEVFAPARVEIVPNGIPDPCSNYATFRLQRRAQAARARRNLSEGNGTLRVLFLSHCTAAKGLFTAIEGIRQAAASTREVSWVFEVAGDFVDAAEKAHARLLFAGLEAVGARVQERGHLPAEQKAEAFSTCDVLVFPSRTESFGLVAVEALAWGVPIVATDIPGIRAVLGPLPCPRIPVDDAAALAQALLNPATYLDPDDLRQRYQSEFTVMHFAERIRRALA